MLACPVRTLPKHIAPLCCANLCCAALPCCSNGPEALKKHSGDQEVVEAAMEAGDIIQQVQQEQQVRAALGMLAGRLVCTVSSLFHMKMLIHQLASHPGTAMTPSSLQSAPLLTSRCQQCWMCLCPAFKRHRSTRALACSTHASVCCPHVAVHMCSGCTLHAGQQQQQQQQQRQRSCKRSLPRSVHA
jgi:hypothetical protein